MKRLKNHGVSFGLATTVLLTLSYCTPSRNIVYFRDLDDTARIHVQDSIQHFEARIQQGDVLGIQVSSADAVASAPFNPGSAQGTGAGGAVATGAHAYQVDPDGTIDFPILGKIHAAGLTTAVLRDTLMARLADSDYLKEPHVSVQYLNYKITVLGEVARPATYPITDGKATLLDALGMAGDLTIFGKRKNVTVIREEGGVRTFAKLDLTSSQVFRSPYFYLHQNDVVYVEPNKAKSAASDDRVIRGVSLAAGMLAVVLSLVYLLK
ncbi:polysaccharide biosynthesis/export family protein [Dinghuibacter silviterrae]|uniref:Polysaccharide export outer membrane protein n=1 Tax=Dinghuibacter silviterrae TaxID=1539049 RepID=A0A4R8DPI4_9BACT|nr:polysaccharide biosynthesis/export family protein [Dinghuibacter silviterrae]TDX00030.1 polysaccharide export outer membrane protein [Dinghuibacter silviterrae]